MKYQGTWGTMSTVAADEGFWGLWRGNLANVLRVVPVYALKFAFNDKFKAIASGGSTAPLTFSQLMMSGTLAVSTWLQRGFPHPTCKDLSRRAFSNPS